MGPCRAARAAAGLAAALTCALLLAATAAGAAGRTAHRDDGSATADTLRALIERMDAYLQRHEVDGVTMDWRYQVSPSEEIRQTVVCQLLAYEELHRLAPSARLREDIVERADYLGARLAGIRSHTPFDGMLGYGLLAAYETTGEARFLETGAAVTTELMAIPTGQCVLNGGLMLALATAEYARLTGDAAAARKTRDILALLPPYQNADGSFPHWCPGSRDIHYTGWMAMELIHLERMTGDPSIAPMLARMTAFLEQRLDAAGRSVYEGPCPGEPGCTEYYYSRGSGCGYDYDTRGWTVEPAYCTLAFDHAGSPKLGAAMGFLLSIERGGTFADLYGYWPPPDDPEYPWTIADTSAVCMSIIFWALTTELAERAGVEVLAVPERGPAAPAAGEARLTAGPNPARGGCTLRYSLAAAARGSLAIYDAAGRRMCVLESGTLTAGPHATRWDLRDDEGRAAPGGVYFARLIAGRRIESARFALAR